MVHVWTWPRPNTRGAPTELMGSRLEFEMLISDLSSRFINLPAGEVDGAIENALRRVCEVLDIDLAVLWQWSATPRTHRAHALLPRPGGPAPAERMRAGAVPLDPAGDAGRSSGGDVVAGASSRRRLPSTASTAATTASSRISAVPLSVGGEPPVGLIGFNTLEAERDWPDAVVKRLELIAQVFTNALARKRTDEALRESEERLSLAADSADAGLWVLDYASRVFWVTERTRSIFGFSADESITMERFEAAVHPDDLGLVRQAIERSARAAEDPVIVEYRIVLPIGGERWISSRGRPRLTSTGEPDRLMGVSIDISERKRVRGGAAPPVRRVWRRAPSSPASRSTKWISTPARCTRTTGCATSAASLPTGSPAWGSSTSGWSTCIPTTAPG